MANEHQIGRRDQPAVSIGKVSFEPLTHSVSQVTAGAASGVLLAADTTSINREVLIYALSNAVTDANGVCGWIDYGQAASSADFPIVPGTPFVVNTLQEIRVIRAGASDVTMHLDVGVKTA